MQFCIAKTGVRKIANGVQEVDVRGRFVLEHPFQCPRALRPERLEQLGGCDMIAGVVDFEHSDPRAVIDSREQALLRAWDVKETSANASASPPPFPTAL